MRGMAVGATLAAAVLVTAAPAVARPLRSFEAPLTATGAITVSWHGDPARGCAAAGLCGYRGSVSVRPSSDGQLQIYPAPRGLSDFYGYTNVAAPPTIRVQRAREHSCVDLLPIADLDIFFSSAGPGRVRPGIENPSLDSGRCAGPDLSDVLARLPSRAISIARLRRGGVTIAQPGHASFADGRFSGTITSTLRMRVGRPARDSNTFFGDRPPSPPGHRTARRRRVVEVRARYRVTSLTGRLTTSFAGLAAPFCTNLDACGVSGKSSWGILSAGGTVLVETGAYARAGDRGLSGALAAIARERGRVAVASDGRLRHALGGTAVTVTRPDGPDCHDSHSAKAPDFGTAIARARIALSLGGEGVYSPGGDLVRTGCPGPQQAEVLGSDSVAHGSVPLSALLRHRVEVPLRGHASFRDPSYSGVRRARFTVGLRREALRVSYGSVRVGR
jgi:hypothetical protein